MSAFVINPYSFVSDNITEFAFLNAANSITDATTYTFTGVDLGAADANRRIIVSAHTRSAVPGHTLSSATIGGESATILANYDVNPFGGGVQTITFVAATVPTGTSGTIVLNYATTSVRMAYAVYRVVSNSALTLANSASSNAAASSTSVSVSAENGIVLVGAGTSNNVSAAVLSFSGIANTDSNQLVEGNTNFAFASERVTTTATQTVTATRSSGTNVMAFGVCLK